MDPVLERVAQDIVHTSLGMYKHLGPGLLETVYEAVLAQKLEQLGYLVERQKAITIQIDGMAFDEGFRADLIINGCLIVELKSVEKLAPVHAKQLITYLRLTGFRLGLLINFGEELLKDGIKRIANQIRPFKHFVAFVPSCETIGFSPARVLSHQALRSQRRS